MDHDLAALLANREPVEESDTRYHALFKDLQCNILTAHGKKCEHYFFLRFGDKEAVRLAARYFMGMLPRNSLERDALNGMLRSLQKISEYDALPEALKDLLEASPTKEGPLFITPNEDKALKDVRAASEFEVRGHQVKRWQASKSGNSYTGGNAFEVNLLLSRSGYAKLNTPLPWDAAFQAGMAASREKLSDPARSSWETEFSQGVDAVLIVAYNAPDKADKTEARAIDERLGILKKLMKPIGDVWTIAGQAIPSKNMDARTGRTWHVEPFGYRDGISQPVFYKDDIINRMALSAVNGTNQKWDPAAPLNLAITPDPNGKTRDACGTYFVLRKLKQNIELFYGQAEKLADRSGLPPSEVAARLVGRLPNGDPLVEPGGPLNDFDYSADSAGRLCPFHAHVRKVNPRSDVAPMYGARERRIIRRGIPYGPEIERDDDGVPVLRQGKIIATNAGDKDANDRIGLLFLCAQSNIVEQFEYLQKNWANSPDSTTGRMQGADTLIGQSAEGSYHWIELLGNTPIHKPSDGYQQVVTLLGGEYLFAPSISFLRGLLDDILSN